MLPRSGDLFDSRKSSLLELWVSAFILSGIGSKDDACPRARLLPYCASLQSTLESYGKASNPQHKEKLQIALIGLSDASSDLKCYRRAAEPQSTQRKNKIFLFLCELCVLCASAVSL